jgi:hypothetical protein
MTLCNKQDAKDQPVPSFNLNPNDALKLQEILVNYTPYTNGFSAVYWHIVGVIGAAREQANG